MRPDTQLEKDLLLTQMIAMGDEKIIPQSGDFYVINNERLYRFKGIAPMGGTPIPGNLLYWGLVAYKKGYSTQIGRVTKFTVGIPKHMKLVPKEDLPLYVGWTVLEDFIA